MHESDPAARTEASIDPAEIEKFAAMADSWWDPEGKFKPLHRMAPARLAYIRDHVCDHFGRSTDVPRALDGLTILDIGCGGGLLTEPMVRLGGTVMGVDATAKNIEIARAHAQDMGLAIDYRVGSAEALVADGVGKFDLVLAMEIVEHVADPEIFVGACAALLAPGGMMIVSTLNRTARSFAMAIVGAEYVLRWLPRGTHDWRKFLKPSELARYMRGHGLQMRDLTGMTYRPLTGIWGLDRRDVTVNYVAAFTGEGSRI